VRIEPVKIYAFSELSEPAQRKALQLLEETYSQDDWWECTVDDFKEELREAGIEVRKKDIEWDVGPGQYVCLTKPFVNSVWLAATVMGLPQLGLTSVDLTRRRSLFIESLGRRSGSRIAMEGVRTCCGDEEELCAQCEAVSRRVNAWFSEKCEAFLKNLREQYDYVQSEEYLRDMIEANDYEFLQDGKRW
jgi:hypothetical protein